ncbi:MAG: DUF5663 domain-containing protein [Candidatus Falkowbacteria bacterium]|nr:DUF5663 domain-containing protein [Candidatus Falkowbacteria bacterium]
MQDILNRNIIKELGIDSLPEKEKREILERIGKVIFESIMIRVIEALDEDGQIIFEQILSEAEHSPNKGEMIIEFLRSKVPNIDEVIEEEVIRFKKDSIDVMGAIK